MREQRPRIDKLAVEELDFLLFTECAVPPAIRDRRLRSMPTSAAMRRSVQPATRRSAMTARVLATSTVSGVTEPNANAAIRRRRQAW